MSKIPIGSTDSARTAEAVIVVNRATGEPAGTSDTTEATQTQVLAAARAIQVATEATQAAVKAPASQLPKQPLEVTSDLTHGFSTSSVSGETTLAPAISGQTTRVHRLTVTAAAATVVEIRDGTAGTALKTFEFPAAGAFVYDFSERPYAKTSANTSLTRNSTVATKVTVDFDYVTSA